MNTPSQQLKEMLKRELPKYYGKPMPLAEIFATHDVVYGVWNEGKDVLVIRMKGRNKGGRNNLTPPTPGEKWTALPVRDAMVATEITQAFGQPWNEDDEFIQ